MTKEPDGGDQSEIVEIVENAELEDHARLRSAFVNTLTKLGCEWASRKLFPWKGLPGKLASTGVVCHNFPDSVPFPGEDHPRSKAGSKGISDLSLADCSSLIAAFSKPSKEGGLYFKHNPKMIADLCGRKLPVIIGAAPDFDSPHQFAKRLFADGSFDQTGPPRAETITITDSDDNTMQRKGKQKATGRPPTSGTHSLARSAETQKITDPPVGKRTLPLRNCRPAQEQPAESKDMLSEAEVQDISSPSGSEFNPKKGNKQQSAGAEEQDDDETTTTSEGVPESDDNDVPNLRKHKAKGELASRHPKMCGFVEVPPAPYNHKTKGKAPARSLKRGRVAASSTSSDDKGENEKPAPVRASKRSRVGTSLASSADEGGVSKGNAPRVPSMTSAITGSAPKTRKRPKPHLVTKGKMAVGQEGDDLFSRRKCSVNVPTQTSSVDTKTESSDEPTRMPEDTGTHSPGGDTPSVLHEPAIEPNPSSRIPCEMEGSLHGELRSEPPVKSVVQPQGVENPTIPASLGHERVPFAPGWFGPPGPGPRFHGYPGPFLGPYGGWAPFPSMDLSGPGPFALPAGTEGQSGPFDPSAFSKMLGPAGIEGQKAPPFDLSAFFKMYGQQLMYPGGNVFIPGNASGAGTSGGGQAAQSEGTGSNTK